MLHHLHQIPTFGLGCVLSLVALLPSTLVSAKGGPTFNPLSFDPGFNISTVIRRTIPLPTHSWEFGTLSEALLELYNPSLSVFSESAFPIPANKIENGSVLGLTYAQSKITIGAVPNGLADGDGAVGDPASLGVSAVLLGMGIEGDENYLDAAKNELEYLVNGAPRWPNGAISHRADIAELWADFIYMAPPFIAYYAVATSNETLLRASVEQCGLYREILRANFTTPVPYDGLWTHILGPQNFDPGLWSTGNAWAAAGMARVLATVLHAPKPKPNNKDHNSDWRTQGIANLSGWIKEILDGAIASPSDPTSGLLRNYLDDTSGDGHGFGEISGSNLLASVAYRMVVLQPRIFGSRYSHWADGIRKILGQRDSSGNGTHVLADGTVIPAVNPLGWGDTTPFLAGSPEGQSFVILMYAAWRDCILAGQCAHPRGKERLHQEL